jgi:hypothetical protein
MMDKTHSTPGWMDAPPITFKSLRDARTQLILLMLYDYQLERYRGILGKLVKLHDWLSWKVRVMQARNANR